MSTLRLLDELPPDQIVARLEAIFMAKLTELDALDAQSQLDKPRRAEAVQETAV